MKFSEFPAHHAILITHPDRALYAESLWNEVSKLSPAHRFFNQTVLDIDTARSIISWAGAPYNEDRIAVISFHTAGIPAQNAMLKVLEEPRIGTRFVLVTTDTSNLIPTVLSRLHHVHEKRGIVSEVEGQAKIFLQTPQALRMKLPFIAELLTKEDEEGRKDREAIKAFILSVVGALHTARAEPKYATETLEIASYASDPSSSGKALLEYLALLLPQIK